MLDASELLALRSLERAAVLRAAAAGGASALASVVATLAAAPLLGPAGEAAPLLDQLPYWTVVGGVTVVASVAEIVFLYWDALRTTHRLAAAAGLALADEDRTAFVVSALARAALELPNPKTSVPGVDPDREASKLVVAIAALAYKLKVAATSFLLKALIRRALGRAAVRVAAELVAIPVTAAWNAAVCAIVLREARLRAAGPSAAHELARLLVGDAMPAPHARAVILSAVGAAIVRTGDSHPNHAALYGELEARLGRAEGTRLDDTRAFIASLGRLDPADRGVALRTLAAATIIDGRLRRSEIALLREAFGACELPFDRTPVEALRRAFTRGRTLDGALLAAVTP